jgi:hypothetical protein
VIVVREEIVDTTGAFTLPPSMDYFLLVQRAPPSLARTR